jgi:ERCC4-type nuclease
MLKISDVCNISRYAYEEVHKQVKKEVQNIGEKLKMSLLPTLRSISTLRKKIYLELHEYIGEHYHIHDSIEYTLKSGTSQKQKNQLVLNEKNSFLWIFRRYSGPLSTFTTLHF